MTDKSVEGPRPIVTADDFLTPRPMDALRLDIACGQSKREGFRGIDIWEGADIVHDLTKYPWPIENDSVYEANLSHYAEHVQDISALMHEIYRILQPGGTVRIVSPYWTSLRAWQDFTHVRPITELTFSYFDQAWLKSNKLDHYPVTCDFECLNLRYWFTPEWEPRAEEVKMWAAKHYVNVVADIEFLLRAVKPARARG